MQVAVAVNPQVGFKAASSYLGLRSQVFVQATPWLADGSLYENGREESGLFNCETNLSSAYQDYLVLARKSRVFEKQSGLCSGEFACSRMGGMFKKAKAVRGASHFPGCHPNSSGRDLAAPVAGDCQCTSPGTNTAVHGLWPTGQRLYNSETANQFEDAGEVLGNGSGKTRLTPTRTRQAVASFYRLAEVYSNHQYWGSLQVTKGAGK